MPTRRSLAALAFAVLPTVTRAQTPSPSQSGPEILAHFPNGTFLENLVVGPDGRVLFTNYFAGHIEQWTPAGGARTFAEVRGQPVSLTALDAGRHALAVHGAPFNGGPAAMHGTGAVLVLDAQGAVTGRIALPEAIFPNGALLLTPGLLLLADSALGRIWAVDLMAGTATAWLDHPLLAPVAGRPYPGVNGIKRSGEALLLSNSAKRQLLRLNLAGTAPRGTPEVIAQMTGGVDDFIVAPDGTVFAATHATGLARLAPGAAAPTSIAAPGLDGSTAVALTLDGRALLALGTGGLLEGGRGEAVLARVAIPPT